MDVLRNYTTYATYFNLLKQSADDPHVERKQAAKALARFLRLHPHNIAQKTEVMVEHFYAYTRHKINGRAKAMVVTDFDQIIAAASVSPELRQAAQVNSADKFALLFRRLLESLFIERMDQNEMLFARYMNDRDFQKVVSEWLGSEVYQRLNRGEE